jgi:hypothetical protein
MADLVRWACRSPQRLLGVLAAALAVVLGIGSLVLDQVSSPDAGTVTAAGEPDTRVRLPDSRPFVDAAVAFVRLWAQPRPGQTAAQWRAALEPLVTADLAAGLRLTDLRNLPGGTPRGTPTVRYLSVTSALVAVPLSSGSTVLVTVVATDIGSSPWTARSATAGTAATQPPPAGGPASSAAAGRGPVTDQGARPSYSLRSERSERSASPAPPRRPVAPPTTADPGTTVAVTSQPGTTRTTGGRWKVADIQPDTGDFGAP